MSWDVVYLLAMFGGIALAGVEALRDKTPRQPWVWTRPDLAWWATRRSARERLRVHVQIGPKKAA